MHRPIEYCSFHSNRDSDVCWWGEGGGRGVKLKRELWSECVMSEDEEEGVRERRQRNGLFVFICSLVHAYVHASALLLCCRWRDDDAGCLTVSPHYHSPTPSIPLPLQLDEPAANRLDSLLQNRDLKIASSHL